MNQTLIWTIIGIVVIGFIGEIIFEVIGKQMYKKLLQHAIMAMVFLAVGGLIVKVIKLGQEITSLFPK